MREDMLEELAHPVMEANKSLDRPSTSWRIWSASNMAQSKEKGLGTRGSNMPFL